VIASLQEATERAAIFIYSLTRRNAPTFGAPVTAKEADEGRLAAAQTTGAGVIRGAFLLILCTRPALPCDAAAPVV
jgi:hypothetical protein